jgi:multicomponent Na+:H+ antiporter subunit E
MFTTAILALPLSVLWMMLSSSVSVGSFIVGYLLGFALLLVIKTEQVHIDHRKLPSQLAALFIYTVTLARDIWMSSMDVARRVLHPDLPLNPGMIAVPTQDEDASDVTAAFSAHGITITPGELVVDFEGSHTMYVHCLDVEASAKNAAQAQAKRLRLLRRIQGGE